MLVLIAAALLAAPALPPNKQTPVKADDDQRVKCETQEVTGTLAGRRRICHTVAEWRAIAEGAERGTRSVLEQGLIQPTHGG